MKIGNMLKGNKRLKCESFSAYKSRRLTENLLLKRYLKGFIIWQGKDIYKHGLDGRVNYPIQLIVKGRGPARKYNRGK